MAEPQPKGNHRDNPHERKDDANHSRYRYRAPSASIISISVSDTHVSRLIRVVGLGISYPNGTTADGRETGYVKRVDCGDRTRGVVDEDGNDGGDRHCRAGDCSDQLGCYQLRGGRPQVRCSHRGCLSLSRCTCVRGGGHDNCGSSSHSATRIWNPQYPAQSGVRQESRYDALAPLY
jgi:hypothetical protein